MIPSSGGGCTRRRTGCIRHAARVTWALGITGLLVGSAAALSSAVAVPAGAQVAPPTDPRAGGDATVARLRQQADALAARYFDALGQLAAVQQHIDDIEARLPVLAEQVATLRTSTRARAVAAYKRSGDDLASVMAARDPTDAARRVQWLGRLNARDGARSEALRAVSAQLTSQRSELRQARDVAAAALDEVRAQGQVIDGLLADAQSRQPPAGPAPAPVETTPLTTVVTATATVVATAPTTTTAPPLTPPTAPATYVPTPGTHPRHDDPFLVCLRTRESSGNYTAYNPAGPYMGAYQFLQTTWNSAANHAGRTTLIGVPPNAASQYDQDDIAWSLYQWQGSVPWGGMCDPP